MSLKHRCSVLKIPAAIAALVVIGIGASAQPNPAPPAASTPQSTSAPTRGKSASAPKGARPNRLKDLEKSLFDPSSKTRLQDSMDNQLNAPLRSSTPAITPQQRQEIERRKNWIFADPDDPAAPPSMEKVFGIREYDSTGREKTKEGAVERYLQKADKNNRGRLDAKTPREARDLTDDFNHGKSIVDDARLQKDLGLPDTIGSAEDDLRKRLDESRSAPGSGRSTLTDIFGLGKKAPTEDELRKRKERMNEFRELIGLPTVATTLSEARSQNGLATTDFGTTKSLPSPGGLSPSQKPDWMSNPFGKPVTGQIPGGAFGNLDSTATATPTYTPPQPVAPSKSTLPKYPISNPQDFSFQRRAF